MLSQVARVYPYRITVIDSLPILILINSVIMVIFSTLLALSVVAGSFAAPTDPVKRDIAERGPHDFALGQGSTLSRRSAINYDQDYTTGGTVNYTPSSTGFSVSWDTEDDFVVGVGWTTGSSR